MRNTRPAQWLLLAAITLPCGAFVVPVLAEPGQNARAETKPRPNAPATKAPAAKDRRLAYAGQNDAPAIKPAANGAPPNHAPRQAVDPLAVAAQVDALILEELKKTTADVAPRCSDEDFLRRVSFDVAGVSPSPQEVTLFGLDPDSRKRSSAIDRLLASPEYAENWSRYWRDVVFSRATEMRALFARPAFEKWLKAEFAANKSWDEIDDSHADRHGRRLSGRPDGPDLRPAGRSQGNRRRDVADLSGNSIAVRQLPRPPHRQLEARAVPQSGGVLSADAIAAQTRVDADAIRTGVAQRRKRADGAGARRIFTQFQQNPEFFIRRLDTNGDGKISREEAKAGPNGGQFLQRLFDQGDANKDGFLTAAEIKKIPPPQIRSRAGTRPSTTCPTCSTRSRKGRNSTRSSSSGI